MASGTVPPTDIDERPGPSEITDPLVRLEMRRAAVWIGMALLVIGVIFLAHPLLLIVGGAIFAVLLDGGVRLFGKVLPIGRGWRLLLVILLAIGFFAWLFYYAGTTIGAQADALRKVVTAQFVELSRYVESTGLLPEGQTNDYAGQLLGSLGKLTSFLGTAVGGVTSAIMMMIIGMFIAAEPALYDRGVAWMLPQRHRKNFYRVADHVGFTLRRLLFGRLVGMVFEGFVTFVILHLVGVPMAALLGIMTGILAFIPNIGAIISGVLIIAVGFSAGVDTGIYAIITYFVVQNLDGYLVVPYIARKTVDLAPALVLAMQLIMGALFGLLGILLADPILATLKVVLIDVSERSAAEAPEPLTEGAG